MTTDDDIVRALEGRPDADQQRHHNAIIEAFGGNPQPINGMLPIQRRGDDFEEVSIWAAKEAASRAIEELSEAIMREDRSTNIYAAEHEAKAIAAEAYEASAQNNPYEDERHRAIESYVTKMAARLRARSPRTAGTSSRPTSNPLKAAESTTVTARRREQIREDGAGGRITNL